MYVNRNIAARLRNHFALETTIYSLHVVVGELHVAIHYIKNTAHCTTMLLWHIYVTDKNANCTY